MKKLIMFLLIIAPAVIIVNGQEKYSITVHADVKDSLNPSIRRLQMHIYDLYSYENVLINSSKYEYDSVPDVINIKLSIPAKKSHLLINYTNSKTISPTYFYLKNYLVEDGDSLICTFYQDSIHFSGKGSEKLNLQTSLFKAGTTYNYLLPEVARYDNESYFADNISIYNRNFEKQVSLLNKYKTRISESFYEYLYYQCLGWKNFMYIQLINNSFRAGGPKFNLRAIDFYKRKFQGMTISYSGNAHLSPLFADFIYEKEKLDFKLDRLSMGSGEKKDAPILLAHILNKYKGALGERLLIIGLSDLPNTYQDTYSFLDTALTFRKKSPYRRLFDKIKGSLTPKADAFPFSLPDSAGKIVKLVDFKGKVVIVDFWFTGCKPCQTLSEKMGPIIDSFKGKDVVFVTINIENNRNYWVASLRSGTYTHHGTFDLYTEGLGTGHPIITHYNITSYPKLLIIDKESRLITAEPPKPSNSDLNATSKFINLIESAL